MTQKSKGTALITGASSGIGAIYADRLARRGYDLILVARNQSRLNELAKRLADETERAIEVVAADLGNKPDLGRVEQILRTDASITLLVNNAGVGATGPLLTSDVDKMEEMITLNVNALTRLTYAVVPGLVARGTGAIINIASIVGIAPEVLNGVTAPVRPSCSPLPCRFRRNLPTGISAFRRCSPAPRPPISGTLRELLWSMCRVRSSCPPRLWWTPRSPASISANRSQSRRCRRLPIGRLMKRLGRHSCQTFPSGRRRHATGLRHSKARKISHKPPATTRAPRRVQ